MDLLCKVGGGGVSSKHIPVLPELFAANVLVCTGVQSFARYSREGWVASRKAGSQGLNSSASSLASVKIGSAVKKCAFSANPPR